jgi:hypothetical protein
MPLLGTPRFVTILSDTIPSLASACHLDNLESLGIKEIRRPNARPPHFGWQQNLLYLYHLGDSLVCSVLLTRMVKSAHPTKGFERPHP